MKYRSEIDGLRAIAVIPVVLYHAGVPYINGGFAGVDVFFVISGFLITRIIAEQVAEQRFSLLLFYERRARRILPALLTVMLFNVPVAWFVMVPYQLEDFTQSIVATMAFISNVLFWFEADYFAIDGKFKPLLHTWSLAVEEQFYIFFPLLLMVLYWVGWRLVLAVLCLIAVASFLAALHWGGIAPSATFFLFHFRAWELLVGSLAAVWVMERRRRPNELLSVLGILSVCASFFLVSQDTIWPGPWTLMPVLGCCAVLLFATSERGVGKVLSWGPVRGIGLISYSLYLWHWPLLVFLNIHFFGDPPASLRAAAVLASVLLSWATWRFIEKPYREPKVLGVPAMAGSLILIAIPIVCFGLIGARSSGFQSYKIAQIPENFAAQVINREDELALRRQTWPALLERSERPFSQTSDKHKVLILGDSLSEDLFVATGGNPDMFEMTEFRRQRLDDKCMPLFRDSLAEGKALGRSTTVCGREVRQLWNAGLVFQANEVVLAANWQKETYKNGIALSAALTEQNILASILGVSAFNDMASLSLQLRHVEGATDDFFYKNIRTKFIPINAEMQSWAKSSDSVRYLDKLSLFCSRDEQTCDMLDAAGKPILYDSAHFTAAGIKTFSARIKLAKWFE